MSSPLTRRTFFERTMAAAVIASTRRAEAADASDLKAIQAEVEKRHDESVHRVTGLDPPAVDCRGEPGHDRGLRSHDAPLA